MNIRLGWILSPLPVVLLLVGCGPKIGNGVLAPNLTAPNGGSLAAVADGKYHVEAVLDRDAGALEIHTLDAEAKASLNTASEGLETRVKIGSAESRFLILAPVASVTKGTFAGNTALYRGEAEWLKTKDGLTVVIDTLVARGRKYQQISVTVPPPR